jgi:hypothetical protein
MSSQRKWLSLHCPVLPSVLQQQPPPTGAPAQAELNEQDVAPTCFGRHVPDVQN